MLPHEERVVAELAELNHRLTKLKSFLFGSTFRSLPPDEQVRLVRQSDMMALYADVLQDRINHFPTN